MSLPAVVVRTARTAWRCQWHQLMGGLGPADAAGRYRRPAGAFTALPPLPDDAATAGSHVLIVGRSCPWAHRAWLVWSLRQLSASIDLLVVLPDPQAGRWRFATPFEDCLTLADLYRRSGAPGVRATVPVLYSRSAGRIVVTESARLIELLDAWPSPTDCRLNHEQDRPQISAWRERLQTTLNDGVYRCGFARNQAAYDEAEAELTATLIAADQALAERARQGEAWLCGPDPSLADVMMFPTLIRMELIYGPLFGCGRMPLWSLPALWQWRQRFLALDGVAATCCAEAWRHDYFGALFPLHPSGIIPAAADLATLVAGPQPLASHV